MSWMRHLQAMLVFGMLAAWGIAQQPADPKAAPAAEAGKPAATAPAATAPTAPADDDNAKHSPLGVKQKRVQQLVKELRTKFDELAKSKAIEPEQRERIYAALAAAEKSKLENAIEDVVKSLDLRELSSADANQQKVLVDIKNLIKILTEDKDEREEQIRKLEEYAKEIEKLKKDEINQKINGEKIAEKDRTLQNLDAQIKAVENLIRREKEIVGKTEAARSEGIQKLGPIADEQRDVRGSTEALAKEIGADPSAAGAEAKPGEGKPGEGKPGEGKPGEGKPNEGKPGEGKPGEGKPTEGKPTEGKPGEEKPSEGKPGEGKPGEGKPGEGKPGEGKPGEGKPGEGGMPGEGKPGEGKPGGESGSEGGDQPGQKPLQKAAKHQKSAENDLGKGKGKAAEAEEQKAVSELEKAKAELKAERDRIASLPPEAFDRMAEKQDQTADKTGDLAKQMAKDEADKKQKSGGSPGSPSGEPGDSDSEGTPGKQKVQDAQQQMQQASGKLKRKEPKQASANQKKAVKDLDDALDEIKKKLAQLRKEMQRERLAALEAHFRQMLEIQKPITVSTAKLERIRVERQWQRKEILDLGKLAVGEKDLSAMAQKGLDIIVEDGTSVVFPKVVEQLRDDLTSVGKLLDAKNAGSYTQAMQREIESTLRELIEALEQAQKQADMESDMPPSEQEPSEQEDEPLLPNSAELKLLKAAQLRVNRRTKSFDDIRPDGDLEPVLREEVRKIARQQENVGEMTRAMVERN